MGILRAILICGLVRPRTTINVSNVFDANSRDRVSTGAAADVGRTSRDRDAHDELSVIKFSDHSFRQIYIKPTVLRQIYLAQLDRVEGHGDLVDRQSGTLERDRHFVFELEGVHGHRLNLA